MPLTAFGEAETGPIRPCNPAPANHPLQAPVSSCCATNLLIVMLLFATGCGASVDEKRLAPVWSRVQVQFDRLERFELEFRHASVAEVSKTDQEKLEFVRKALERRAGLQVELTREMQQATKALMFEPESVRSSYVARLRSAVERLKVVQNQTKPAIEKLRLQKYVTELGEYRVQADRAAAGESR